MSAVSFDYRAMDKAGREARGTISAPDKDQAYRKVVESGLTPLTIRPATRAGRRARGKVRLRDITQFTYQLQVLLEARIPIGDGLAGLAHQEENQALKAVLIDIASQVEAGHTIAAAMSPHRRVFGDVYLETINAAEQSGTMLKTLDQLSEALERMEQSKRQVINAMLYPLCVLATLFLASGFLVTYTIPKFASMFAARGVELPLLTRLLAAMGNSVHAYWWAYLIGVVAAAWLGRWAFKHQGPKIERFVHRVPAVRAVLVGLAMSRFARVLSASISAGLGLLEAMQLAKRAAGRHQLSVDVDRIAAQIRAGERLSDGLAATTYIPSFARRMLTAGDESGELIRMTEIVAKHYERELSHRIKALTTVMEPVLVVLIAGVVLMVALAIFLPMWNMVQVMS